MGRVGALALGRRGGQSWTSQSPLERSELAPLPSAGNNNTMSVGW